jgi:hypothetical protein
LTTEDSDFYRESTRIRKNKQKNLEYGAEKAAAKEFEKETTEDIKKKFSGG